MVRIPFLLSLQDIPICVFCFLRQSIARYVCFVAGIDLLHGIPWFLLISAPC